MTARIPGMCLVVLCFLAFGCASAQKGPVQRETKRAAPSGILCLCDQCGNAFPVEGFGTSAYSAMLTNQREHTMRQLAFCSQKCKTAYLAAKGITNPRATVVEIP